MKARFISYFHQCKKNVFLNFVSVYLQETLEPQSSLLRYVLQQPYSRDMVGSMLGLSKQVESEEQRRNSVNMPMQYT